MYHPQDGYEAYMKDILKYLLSIIPPPNLYGSFDVNSMKEEVREITGFSLLSTPAFHTWQVFSQHFSSLVLPVLKNNSSTHQKEIKPENQLSTQTQISYPKEEVKPDVQQNNKKEETNAIPDIAKITTNVNSDNESVISEPKLENYDLYEIVGDLSKTILNQLSSKPDYDMAAYNRMKNFFDLEAVMTPSALKPPSGGNEDKQIALAGEVGSSNRISLSQM
ncbi:hypothetical protein C0J52_27602 [Blattella germanica]|nr:hypothetical protein C0J52_27602 [Blattella germanica]